MSSVNIFIFTPEINPQFEWVNGCDTLISDRMILDYLEKVKIFKNVTKLEKYNGYFDKKNFDAILIQFEILDDCFPFPLKRRLESLYKDFIDWRKNPIQSNNYAVFNQSISDHSLCEVSERMHCNVDNRYAIFNNQAITINKSISITINAIHVKTIDLLKDEKDFIDWFSENRIPKRNFHSIPKHNIPEPITILGKKISPLKGTVENADEVLKFAIGKNIKELFGFDKDCRMILVFKHENNTPQNQYHGYHVPVDSSEVSDDIKRSLGL